MHQHTHNVVLTLLATLSLVADCEQQTNMDAFQKGARVRIHSLQIVAKSGHRISQNGSCQECGFPLNSLRKLDFGEH